MAKKPSIFPTFFVSGFECSTFLWKDKKRRNLVAETGHDKQAMRDYQLLRSLGIAVACEEYREHDPHQPLAPDDERINPLCDLLRIVWERYQRPMIIGETSGMNDGRAHWLRDVMEESLAAVDSGIDLHAICLFPAVDMPDWHTGKWVHNGICDVEPQNGELKRIPNQSYIDELHRWQKELNRVTVLDDDPFSDPVELQDVTDAAQRLKKKPDKNWS